MIETEYKTIKVVTEKERVCLRIEDKDSVFGELNLCWFTAGETRKLIGYLQDSVKKLEGYEARINELINTTYFDKLYGEFEDKYNPYPVQMSRESAFGHALRDGLITEDLYDAARRYYKRLWDYVGD